MLAKLFQLERSHSTTNQFTSKQASKHNQSLYFFQNLTMSKKDPVPHLTQELAMEILNKTLEQLQQPDNLQKIEEARDNVGNEMLKVMQFIFPIVMQIQMEVIKEFGFPETREGIIKFSQLVRGLERDDSEVARLHGLIKAYYLPPVSAHTNNESGEERTSSS